jgi:uncharacterized iron-regulated membrane protein
VLTLFRKVLFWSHLVAGVTAGVVILIMSVTGVALTYQKEMQYWADTRHFRTTAPDGAARATVADLVASVRAADPAFAPATITWQSDARLPVAIAAGQKTLYVNPYTCEVFGEGAGQSMRAFFTTMTNWHRYLAMSGEGRPTGKALTGASNLLFLFIVLSGMYLWWPKIWNAVQFRNITWFRGGLRAKARDFNWHNTFGFWFALPLVFVVASGTVISYPWASNAAYRVMGEEPPAPGAGGPGGGRGAGPDAARGGPGGWAGGPGVQAGNAAPAAGAALVGVPAFELDRHVAHVMDSQPGWRSVALRVPTSTTAPLVFTIDRGDAGQPNLRGTLTVDARTGNAQKWEDFSTQTPGRRLRTILRFTHTGEIAGFLGQTIAGLASFAGAMLVYTGISLSLRRLGAWMGRRTKTATKTKTA